MLSLTTIWVSKMWALIKGFSFLQKMGLAVALVAALSGSIYSAALLIRADAVSDAAKETKIKDLETGIGVKDAVSENTDNLSVDDDLDELLREEGGLREPSGTDGDN